MSKVETFIEIYAKYSKLENEMFLRHRQLRLVDHHLSKEDCLEDN